MRTPLRNGWMAGALGALALGGLVFGGTALAGEAPAAGEVEARTAQPHMISALSLLESAHSTLQAAAHNKGGHRVKAMGFVDGAITEVKKGIKFAATNEGVADVFMGNQPKMKLALRRLTEARSELELARANKGGHRKAALDLTNKAIAEVELGLAAGAR